jgi:hypothetical protein
MLAGECKCACVAVELVSSVSEWQVQKYMYQPQSILYMYIRGASKIKLEKANKKENGYS